MSSSKEEDAKKKKEELKKKLSSVKQMTLFGLKNYKVTQHVMKKVKKNEYKKVGEFIRVESSHATTGVFQHICVDCLRQFVNKQGLGSHRAHCQSAIATQAKHEAIYKKEILDTHDNTVFICSEEDNSSSG